MKTKILIALDKYKGNLSAMEICKIIGNSIKEMDKNIEVILNPMADGGEGTVDTLVGSLKGKYISLYVTGPLGDKIKSRFGIINNKIAVIEMSAASGLWLIPTEKRNPMETTTYGTGELIGKAMEIGCKKIIIGIGGSATNDGGMGMAQALGVKFYDKNSNLLGFGGKELIKINRIDMSDRNLLLKDTIIEVACDVGNPLFGKNGAAYIYAPQKGADEKMVQELDKGLLNFAEVIKKDLVLNVAELKGAGAAGGLGAGLVAFLNAKLKNGVDIVMEATGIENKMRDVDLVITGEGAFDRQTFFGKSPYGVAILAKKYKKPVITINGSVNVSRDEISERDKNLFSGNFSTLNAAMNIENAIKNSRVLLKNITKELITFYLSIKNLK
ncbi:MAG: glycerate kinase [Actinobacteria bacterium]|nr:glycerate kinase [Actinomycetota bacterium]